MKTLLRCTLLVCAAGCATDPTLSNTSQEIGGDESGNDAEPEYETTTLPATPAPWPSDPLAQTIDASQFKPSDPATWSWGKRLRVCAIYANNVVERYQDGHLFQPAVQACMTGMPVDVGLDNYQTYAMKRDGFTPTDPDDWSLSHRSAVCDELRRDVHSALADAGTADGYTITMMSNQAKSWCSTNGVTSEEPPPTRWELSRLEYLWWKRQLNH